MSDTKTDAKSSGVKLNTDDAGNLIDPPVIPEYEQRLAAAHNAADDDTIAEVAEEYATARKDLATKQAKRAQERANR